MHMAQREDQTMAGANTGATSRQRQLRLRLAVDMAETERLTAALDEFAEQADLQPEAAMQMNLMLEELITNVIKYGYPGGRAGAGAIDVDIERACGELRIRVSDDGDAFDPFSAAEPDLSLDIAERPIGGLGIHLIRKLADAYSYSYRDGRNHTHLVKRLAAES